ncbi:MAG TPA: enoyl-CoA hydratase [Actinomycetota bacterium]|nr:enoyl-CoA hydratase [Actinomycetota bacterium]
MSYETLIYDLAGGVATITLNRPEKRNAVNRTMFEELEAVFDEIAASSEVRVFVLQGAGDHFCSGADLSTLDEAPKTPFQMLARMEEIHRIMRKIVYCPKPGIAAVRGYAAGGGANLALACDLVVMADDAKFAELFVKRGLVVDMSGTFTLPRTVGLHRAKELALLGDTIDAARAYEFGIANRVVPVDELEITVKDLASRLAAGPPIALSFMKKALNDSFAQTFDEVLSGEAHHQAAIFSTHDFSEAISAFFEKRTPSFTGE